VSSALVFAYHNVGVRCLQVLRNAGVHVALVVTHQDHPKETLWFDSVRQTCDDNGIPFITPDDPNTAEMQAQFRTLAPDFIFSFYYRHMLHPEVLALARHGAYNMHGSLLPQFRGRAPVNWAVIQGAHETGASLHVMEAKPDAGAIVGQTAVPILTDDTAREVFDKVTVAAEITLWRALPDLLSGNAVLRPQDLSRGRYFSRRTPEDGRIDLTQSARTIHNLVRGVAPPEYPGAFLDLAGQRLCLWRTALAPEFSGQPRPTLFCDNGALYLSVTDGTLKILCAQLDKLPFGVTDYLSRFSEKKIFLS
jgi:methionyl-tRNA formyltransferase